VIEDEEELSISRPRCRILKSENMGKLMGKQRKRKFNYLGLSSPIPISRIKQTQKKTLIVIVMTIIINP